MSEGGPSSCGFWGRGHTDHDAVVAVPGAAVLFAGNPLEATRPYFGDGFPLDWPATAAALVALVDGVVVPGHGDHGGREFAEDQARTLCGLADLAARVHSGELDFEDALAETPFNAFPAENIDGRCEARSSSSEASSTSTRPAFVGWVFR